MQVSIEPFDPKRHDRSTFSCGSNRLDNFRRRTAKKHQTGGFARVWVATDGSERRVLGYYAVNAHSLEAVDLPHALVRKAPRFGGIPAAYLSMIAVDRRYQGRGLGRFLLADALKRSEAAAVQIGVKAVVLDVIDDGGPEVVKHRRAFYTAMGFRSFPSLPSRMFILVETVRDSFALAEVRSKDPL